MTESKDARHITLSYNVPVIRGTEVLVVGGGSSGIAAATGSARTGAKTLLIDRYGFLGGTSTASLVGPFMTSYSQSGDEQVVRGVFQEIVDRMASIGGAIDPSKIEANTAYNAYIELGHSRVTPFNAEALKIAAVDMLDDAGVELMLHTTFLDTIMNGNTVEGVLVATKAGLGIIHCKRIIDTSADADVAARAGVPYEKGRPEDGLMQPVTMFFRISNVDDAAIEAWYEEHEKIHPGERLFECVVREAREKGEFPIPRKAIGIYREPQPGVWRVNTSRIHGIDGTNPDDLTRAEIEGRHQVMFLMQFFRERLRGFEQVELLETAVQIGVRETRRIVGEYVLSGEDVLEGRRFEDAIGRCGYPVDIHNPKDHTGRLEGIKGDSYDIPYRSLVPKNCDNMLVGGRCISASHVAQATVRVIPPCYATGHAAGVAAALSLRHNVAPRDVDIEELRGTLQEQDAIV